MADYYSILKKTISSLPENNGAARRSVYSRARTAIVNQLKAYEPPLSPSEITAEQLRLEESIRKVEAEAARESLGLGPAAKSTAAPVSTPVKTSGASADSGSQVSDKAAPEPAAPAAPVSADETTAAQQPTMPAPAAASGSNAPSPLAKEVEAAQQLGDASHSAVESTKKVLEAKEPEPDVPAEPVRKEPSLGGPERAATAPGRMEPDDPGIFADEPDTPAEAPADAESRPRRSADRNRGRASDVFARGRSGLSGYMPYALIGLLVLILAGIGAVVYSQRDLVADLTGDDTGAEDTVAAVTGDDAAPSQPADDAAAEPTKNTDRLLDENGEPAAAPDARSVTTTLITPGETESRLVEPQPPVNVEPDTAATAAPEPVEPPAPAPLDTPAPAAPETAAPEVPEPSTPATVTSQEPAPSEETAVAALPPPSDEAGADAVATPAGTQRSILYEEGEDANGAGTAAQGAVVWSLAEETDLEGRPQTVLVADVEIPERDVTVNVRIKPNDDASLPASHLVEIKYEFPENFSAGDVVNVPGLVMKPTEEARGDALLGASVKVSPGYFWIALSSLNSERDRNLGLLRERGWIDIPMLYDNGKRGILTLEKGAAGSAAVEQAISAWTAG
ncbi:MAG: hypothetical protein JJ902_16045 [Roseibium sp.]|nr:hypothetical protein [Roseibium sp.]